MRVRFGGTWIADSEDVVLLHEPGRYPVAYFPLGAISDDVLRRANPVDSALAYISSILVNGHSRTTTFIKL